MLHTRLPLCSIMLAAILVHERSLCMPTCANEALQGCAPSEEHSPSPETIPLCSVVLRFMALAGATCQLRTAPLGPDNMQKREQVDVKRKLGDCINVFNCIITDSFSERSHLHHV